MELRLPSKGDDMDKIVVYVLEKQEKKCLCLCLELSVLEFNLFFISIFVLKAMINHGNDFAKLVQESSLLKVLMSDLLKSMGEKFDLTLHAIVVSQIF
jgi:hypothetical protein